MYLRDQCRLMGECGSSPHQCPMEEAVVGYKIEMKIFILRNQHLVHVDQRTETKGSNMGFPQRESTNQQTPIWPSH